MPTNKWVLFGHHFAAIAGAGPLGPRPGRADELAAGTIWILVGVMLAGAVQDFLVLFISTRRDGAFTGGNGQARAGAFAGVITMLGALG